MKYPDRPGTITLKADHYYDPPPFNSAEDAGKAIATSSTTVRASSIP